MLKKSVLTPVLSGVLAVTVVGSGVGYYNVFVKDKDAADGKKDAKNNKPGILTADKAAEKVENTIDKAIQVVNGELDGGYSAVVSYSLPNSDMGVKDIGFSLEAKQKDKMTGADYAVQVDGKSVLSMNIVYDNDGETAYVKIPELSDAYLTGTASEIESMMNTTGSFDVDVQNDEVLDELNDYDFGALFDDLATYIDVVKDNIPEAADGGTYTVSEGGVSIDLDTKSYTITAKDAKKVADAIADKGRTDTVFKDFFVKTGGDESEYGDFWDEVQDIDEEDDTTIKIDVYYSGDESVGFSMTSNDGGNFRMVTASDDTHVIIDGGFTDDEDSFDISGLLTYEDDTLDGKITAEVNEYGTKSSFAIEYQNITVTDDTTKGTVVMSATEDGTEVFSMKMSLDCSGNDVDFSFTGSVDGESVGTLTVKAQETNASDITVPTGKFYSISDENELQQYLESCDVEGWQKSLQSALGDDLYNSMFGYGYGGYDDYDFDYDLNDYDFGYQVTIDDYDFDFSDFEFADEEAV